MVSTLYTIWLYRYIYIYLWCIYIWFSKYDHISLCCFIHLKSLWILLPEIEAFQLETYRGMVSLFSSGSTIGQAGYPVWWDKSERAARGISAGTSIHSWWLLPLQRVHTGPCDQWWPQQCRHWSSYQSRWVYWFCWGSLTTSATEMAVVPGKTACRCLGWSHSSSGTGWHAPCWHPHHLYHQSWHGANQNITRHSRWSSPSWLDWPVSLLGSWEKSSRQ